MASTVIEFECVPGTTTAYMEAAGGSGTAAASYTITQVAGYLHQITVTEALTGRWVVKAGDNDGNLGYRTVVGLTDTATTFSAPVLEGSGSGPYTLTVTIQDGDTNTIQGARVTINGTTYDETSGSDGTVVFNLDDGTYTLATVPPPGYDTPSNQNKTISGANDTDTITLTASTPGGSGSGWIG